MAGKKFIQVFRPIRYPKFSITIYTGAALEGRGASMGNKCASGAWLSDGKLMPSR